MFATWRHPGGGTCLRLVLAGCAALALLALGDAAHLRHHLDDPGCDSGWAPESHPCVTCVGLHGSALASATPTVSPFATASLDATPRRIPAPPALAATRTAAPRAPPLG